MPFPSLWTVNDSSHCSEQKRNGRTVLVPLFPSAAESVPLHMGRGLVNYWHQLLVEANHCEPFAGHVEKPIQTPCCLFVFAQTGGGFVLLAFPALLPSGEERGKRKTEEAQEAITCVQLKHIIYSSSNSVLQACCAVSSLFPLVEG